ncbi:MAG: hypothetical protein HC767_13665 [Akkermansiaceae bacterium]|nr:hypothetical protein [Akkermansiaceae bacterium]
MQAISALKKVTVLSVPQWKALVGSDSVAVAPLRSMPRLKTVLVDDSIEGPAFEVDGLSFKARAASNTDT